MRNINIVSKDVQDFKILIEILAGFVSEVNAEIIKDKNAYVKARQAIAHDDDSLEYSSDGEFYEDEDDVDELEDSGEFEKSEESEEEIISKKSNKGKNAKTKATKATKSKKSKRDEESEESDEYDDEEDEDFDDIEVANENPGQIKILTPNDDQVMLVFLTLDASHFEKFEVLGKNDDDSTSYTIGLDVEELNKFMKGVPKEGTLSIYQDTDALEYICFDVSDVNRGTANICDLRRINIERPPDKNIEVNVSMVVRMPCGLFHKACKDLQQFDPFVEFICDRDTFKIVCMGEQSNQERRFTDNSRKKNGEGGTDQNYDIKITLSKDIEKENNRRAEEGSDSEDDEEALSEEEVSEEESEEADVDSERSDISDLSEDEPEVIRLLFDLRYINYMYKCSNLADYVYIHLTPRGIMFLSYEINMLGNLLVGIAPKNRETDQDYNEENDQYYEDDKPIKIKRDLN